MSTHTVICHTQDCAFAESPSRVEDPVPVVVCGGCGVQITDIDPPIPEPDLESPAE